MKKFYTSALAVLTFSASLIAQSWQTVGSGFLNSGDIATNLQVLSYEDTAFVAYADMNVVKLKKRSGNNWVTVANQNTENNHFKLIYGTDNKPYFVTLSRAASIVSVGSTGFFADIHEYDNGSLSLIESREMQFVPSGTDMSLQVSNFDFTIRPNGDMAGIIRYPSAARSVYNVKIGSNPWFTETVYYQTIGGTVGNAIEKSNITFFDDGVMILSRLFNQSAGTAHLFLHDNTSSTPTSSILNDGSFGVATSSVNPMSVTSRADTVYMAYRDNSNLAQFRKFYHEPTATEPLASEHLQTFGSEILGMQLDFTSTNNYMSYIEQDNTTFEINAYVNDLSVNYTISGGQVVAGSPFSLGEMVVSPQVMSVNPSNGEIYVAYIHGPPMTQSIVRKFGCGTVSIDYSSDDNELYVSSAHAPTASYEWRKCGETDVISVGTFISPTESGDYQVTVSEGNCVITSACYTVDLSTGEPASIGTNEQADLLMFPNPASSEVTIINAENNTDLTIYDLTGQVVYQNSFSGAIKINTENWSTGVYLLNLSDTNQIRTKRLIIK